MTAIRQRSRRGLLAARLLVAVGAVMLVVGVAEVTARWLAPTAPSLMVPQDGNGLVRHRTHSTALRPSCTGVLYATRVRVNALGLRGPELRDDGSRRILALGDSCTMGWRVAEEESYPAVLEQLLNARSGEPRVQVLNAGVPGYTSHQGLAYFREAALALDPDIVIVAFGWNDADRRGDVVEQIRNENRLLPLIQLDDWLLANSQFYSWSLSAANRARTPGSLARRVPLEQTRRNLNAIAALAAERGAHVLFVSFIGTDKPAGHSLAIDGAAADQNAPLVAYSGPRLDIVHPTADGYRWLGEDLAAAIEAQGWLRADGRM